MDFLRKNWIYIILPILAVIVVSIFLYFITANKMISPPPPLNGLTPEEQEEILNNLNRPGGSSPGASPTRPITPPPTPPTDEEFRELIEEINRK